MSNLLEEVRPMLLVQVKKHFAVTVGSERHLKKKLWFQKPASPLSPVPWAALPAPSSNPGGCKSPRSLKELCPRWCSWWAEWEIRWEAKKMCLSRQPVWEIMTSLARKNLGNFCLWQFVIGWSDHQSVQTIMTQHIWLFQKKYVLNKNNRSEQRQPFKANSTFPNKSDMRANNTFTNRDCISYQRWPCWNFSD